MRQLCKYMATLAFCMATQNAMSANCVFLDSCTVTPGDSAQIALWVENADTLSGLAFEVVFDRRALRFGTCRTSSGPFESFARQAPGRVRIALVSTRSAKVLPPGKRQLLRLSFWVPREAKRADSPLLIQNLSMTNGQFPPRALAGTAGPGAVFIAPDEFALRRFQWARWDSANVDLHLSAEPAISGMQFSLFWTGFESMAWETSSSISNWEVVGRQSEAKRVDFVLADLTGNRPLAQFDADVLSIHFEDSDTSALATSPRVWIDGLLAAGPTGQAVALTIRSAELDASLRPDAIAAPMGGEAAQPGDQMPGLGEAHAFEAGHTEPRVSEGVLPVDSSAVGDAEGEIQTAEAEHRPPAIRISEILADPPLGNTGDANGDGVRSSRHDEFVELHNAGQAPVDLSGWLLGDDDVDRSQWFRFPEGIVLEPGQYLVVFGGGEAAGLPVEAFADDGTIGNGLTNSGDCVILVDADGQMVVDEAVYGDIGSRNQSIVRDGEGWALHGDRFGDLPFSPGYDPESQRDSSLGDQDIRPSEVAEGNDASGGAEGLPTHSGSGAARAPMDNPPPAATNPGAGRGASTEEPLPAHLPDQPVLNRTNRPAVKIVEILADPPGGLSGDANGDGVRDDRHDEFVELMNFGSVDVSLDGWILGDDDVPQSQWMHLPNGTVLRPGERLVVFGGGSPSGIPGQVLVDDGAIGNGLANSGDQLFIVDLATRDTIDCVAFGEIGSHDQSIVWDGMRWVLHAEDGGRTRFSPGIERPAVGVVFPFPADLVMVPGEKRDVAARAHYSDGEEENLPRGTFYWVSGDPAVVSITTDGSVSAKGNGETEIWFAWKGMESLHARVVVAAMPGDIGAATDSSIATGHPQENYGGLAITEIHASPAPGEAGDTNGDGRRDSYEDEFVELMNQGDADLGLTGCFLGDDDVALDRMFRFPEGVNLSPGERLVLFGGGSPAGVHGKVLVDDGRIGDGLSNVGDVIQLFSPDGKHILVQAQIGRSEPGVSWAADGLGGWVLHAALPGKGNMSPNHARPMLMALQIPAKEIEMKRGARFPFAVIARFSDGDTLSVSEGASPNFAPDGIAVLKGGYIHGLAVGETTLNVTLSGIESNGLSIRVTPRGGDVQEAIDGPAPEETEAEVGGQPVLRPPGPSDGSAAQPVDDHRRAFPEGLTVSEIHANPASGAEGDVNGDGVRDAFADEFVELHNAGASPVDLSGWRLGDDDLQPDQMFAFPQGTVLSPGGRLVLFGGGTPRGISGMVFVANGRIGDGLSNSGDCLNLIAPNGDAVVFAVEFGQSSPGVSWISSGGDVLSAHNRLPSHGMASPGRPEPLLVGLHITPSFVQTSSETPFRLDAIGHFNDNSEYSVTEQVKWVFSEAELTALGRNEFRLTGIDSASVRASWGTFESAPCPIVPPVDPAFIADAPDTVLNGSGSDSGGGGPDQPNAPPVFTTSPDTLALVGLPFSYRPDAVDPEGDRLHTAAHALPAWLAMENGEIHGIPNAADLGLAEVSLGVSDGRNHVEQIFSIRVQTPMDAVSDLAETELRSGRSVAVQIDLPEGIQLQVEGGPEWDPGREELTWKPESVGEHRVYLSFSRGRVSEVRVLTLDILPAPASVVRDTASPAFRDTLVDLGGAGSPRNPERGVSATEGDGVTAAPNPFNANTALKFLSEGGVVAITVYNVLGQSVRRLVNQSLPAGFHRRIWDGTDDRGRPLGTGLYLVRVQTPRKTQVQRITLLR